MPVWDEPYLETCCRSALHRLVLCGEAGRPRGLADDPCLRRLEALGFCGAAPSERYIATALGIDRHDQEIARPKRRRHRARA